MPLTNSDFFHGIDATVVDPITGGDLNDLLDMAIPRLELSGTEGKGLLLWTVDLALDTPTVPNPGLVGGKWKRYAWIRVPHATSTDTQPKLYLWNDNHTNDATFLHWVLAVADTATLQAEIDALTVLVTTAINTANAANTTAGNANNLAANANTNANAALAAANDAAANAAQALSDAQAALAAATAAQTTANAALAAAQGNIVVSRITAGNPRQLIRTSTAGVSEWFTETDNYVCIQERQNAGVDAGVAALGINLRALNTEVSDTGGLAAVAGSKVTLAKGKYRIHISVPAMSNKPHQAFLIKDADNSILLEGTSQWWDTGDSKGQHASIIKGTINLANDTVVRVDDVWKNAFADAKALGAAVDASGSYAGCHEIYTVFEAFMIGGS